MQEAKADIGCMEEECLFYNWLFVGTAFCRHKSITQWTKTTACTKGGGVATGPDPEAADNLIPLPGMHSGY